MTIREFWKIVERVHAASPNGMATKCRRLKQELRKLPTKEVESFDRHFTNRYYEAYTWDIMGAAVVINGELDDDNFMDFRWMLISLGSAAFKAALRNADDLADFNINRNSTTLGGYESVARSVVEERLGEDVLDRRKGKDHPKEPAGVRFVEWEMSKRFPRLVAKYRYKDSDYLSLKQEQEKFESDRRGGRQVAKILLNAGMVRSCGLFPPLRIVAAVLPTGLAPASSGRNHKWKPITLNEKHYWVAAELLLDPTAQMLKSRPDLKGVSLKFDRGAAAIDDFDQWLKSLKTRGLE